MCPGEESTKLRSVTTNTRGLGRNFEQSGKVRVWKGLSFGECSCLGRELLYWAIACICFFYRLWLRTLQRACHVPGYAWREFLFGITFGLASVCLKEVLGYRHVTRHGEICIKRKEHKALAAEAAYPNPPKKKRRQTYLSLVSVKRDYRGASRGHRNALLMHRATVQS